MARFILQSVTYRYPVPAFKSSGFNYGTRDDYMKELVEYWSKDYDWKKQEDWMNSFDHFKTNIEGLNVHFIHSKPKNVKKGVEVNNTHGPYKLTVCTAFL